MVTADEERAAQIKTLHGLLDRLCSPDLTLEVAKVLRNQMFDLLGGRKKITGPHIEAWAVKYRPCSFKEAEPWKSHQDYATC